MFYSSWGLNFNTFGMMNPYASFGSLRMYCPADRFVMPDSYFGMTNSFAFNPYMMRFNMMQSMINSIFNSVFNRGCRCQHNNIQTFQPLNYSNVQPIDNIVVQSTNNNISKSSLESRFAIVEDNMANIFNDNYKTSSENIFARKSNTVSKASSSTKTDKLKNKTIQISNKKIASIVHEKAQKYGVDENLILAMISQESSFINGQTSSKGAKGLMQLMPATARELGVTNVNDPEQNIDGGVRYIKKLLNMYGGDVKKALAAYNGGMGNVSDILNGTNKHGHNPNHIKDPSGIPRMKETQNYVSKIYKNYKNASLS